MNSEEDLIVFYKRIFLNTQMKYACKKKTCTDNFCENKEHSLNYLKDPIGMHLICLNYYERDIDESFEKLRCILENINNFLSHHESIICDQQLSTSDQHSVNSNDHSSSSSENVNKLCPDISQEFKSTGNFSNGSQQEHSRYFRSSDYSDISSNSESLCSEHSKMETSNSVQSQLLHKFQLSDEDIKLLDKPSIIPRFTDKYPFLYSYKTSVRQKVIIKSKSIVHQTDIINQLENFVQIILGQTGYSSYESVAIFFMIKSAHKFLKQFVTLMKQHHDDSDLITLVHLMFLKIGYGGIHGVHNFFYNTIVKSHDELYKDCVKKQSEYEKLRQEIVDKYKKCSN